MRFKQFALTALLILLIGGLCLWLVWGAKETTISEIKESAVQWVNPNEQYYCLDPRLKNLDEQVGPFLIDPSPDFAALHNKPNELWWFYSDKVNCGEFGGTLPWAIDNFLATCSPTAIAERKAREDLRHDPPPPDPSLVEAMRQKLADQLKFCLPRASSK